MVDLNSILGSEGARGWTIASLLIFGIIIAMFLPQIAGFIGYGIASALNVSNTIEEEFTTTFNTTTPGTVTVKAGNYTAVIPHHANPVLEGMQDVILPIL